MRVLIVIGIICLVILGVLVSIYTAYTNMIIKDLIAENKSLEKTKDHLYAKNKELLWENAKLKRQIYREKFITPNPVRADFKEW